MLCHLLYVKSEEMSVDSVLQPETTSYVPVSIEQQSMAGPSTLSTATTSRDPRQWAGKRKPRQRVADQRTAATTNISAAALRKIAYYSAKLENERSEHRLRIEILGLEKQLLTKRLEKIAEE